MFDVRKPEDIAPSFEAMIAKTSTRSRSETTRW